MKKNGSIKLKDVLHLAGHQSHFVLAIMLFLIAGTAYSQSLSLFDVDASNFPTIKGKFFAFDANWQQITNFNESDFSITEDGIARKILSVSCPTPKPPDAISSVLVMDVSLSMGCPITNNILLAKEAGKAWVNGLPDNRPWECGITAFSNQNYLIQDFTADRATLLNGIDQLTPGGGTNYDAAFIDQAAGGIRIAETGQYKRVLVFLSDGQPNFEPQTTQIINEARSNAIIVYAVTLRMPCPQCLKDITTQTGGQWFENVTTVEEARAVYLKILQLAQNSGEPCEIEWESDYSCSRFRNVEISCLINNSSDKETYIAPESTVSTLEVNPQTLSFGEVLPPNTKDMQFTLTSLYRPITINKINTNHARFTIENYGGSAPPFTLNEGEQRTITVRYTAPDSGFVYSWLDIESDACVSNRIYLSAGFKDKMANNSLRLVHPNGGEEFLVGIDTVFIWEGVLPTDTVKLEYSTDAGDTWNLITDKATGLRYIWKGVPDTPSKKCLGRVSIGVEEQSLCGCDMPGIVACYPFNGNANDESGRGHNGTVVGAKLTTDRFGKPNSAYYFDGTSRIDIPDHDDLDLTSPLTIAAWIKPDINGIGSILDKGWLYPNPSPLDGYNLTFDNTTGLFWYQRPGHSAIIRSVEPFITSNWTFIVVTQNGDGQTAKMYINTNQVNTTIVVNQKPGINSEPLRIGAGQFYFEGIIDDVKLFKRVLTEEEIQCLYTTNK